MQVRNALPEIIARSYNQGIPASNDGMAKVVEGMTQLSSKFQSDKDILALGARKAAILASKSKSFTEFIAAPLDDAQAIHTDAENPVAEGTERIDNPARFDPDFADAFAWRLAACMCVEVRADPALLQTAEAMYTRALADARLRDAREQHRDPVPDGMACFERARL